MFWTISAHSSTIRPTTCWGASLFTSRICFPSCETGTICSVVRGGCLGSTCCRGNAHAERVWIAKFVSGNLSACPCFFLGETEPLSCVLVRLVLYLLGACDWPCLNVKIEGHHLGYCKVGCDCGWACWFPGCGVHFQGPCSCPLWSSDLRNNTHFYAHHCSDDHVFRVDAFFPLAQRANLVLSVLCR